MYATFWQRGESIDYRNATSKEIKAGDVVVLEGRIGVAGCDIPAGETGSVHVTGVFEVPKDGSAFAVGAKAYYKAGDAVFTSEESGNTTAGWVVAVAVAGDASAKIKIG